MAPPARGSVAGDPPAGGVFSAEGGSDGLAGLAWLSAAISAAGSSWGRGARILVAGQGSPALADDLARRLALTCRCLRLDLDPGRGFGAPGLSEVVAGEVNLSRSIVTRESGIDRLGVGGRHPDHLVRRPHGLAIVLDALGFAYGAVVMNAPSRRESVIADVLVGVSDHAILAPGCDGEDESADALALAARAGSPLWVVRADGSTGRTAAPGAGPS